MLFGLNLHHLGGGKLRVGRATQAVISRGKGMGVPRAVRMIMTSRWGQQPLTLVQFALE